MALDTTKIDNERKALQLLADQVQNTKDPDERDMLIEAIKKSAADLEKMCAELQAEADKIAEAAPKPKEDINAVVEVILTPEQRKRVLAQTGIDVPSIKIPDPSTKLTANMQHLEPEFVEKFAMEQAERFKQMVEDAEADMPEEDQES